MIITANNRKPNIPTSAQRWVSAVGLEPEELVTTKEAASSFQRARACPCFNCACCEDFLKALPNHLNFCSFLYFTLAPLVLFVLRILT